MQTELFQLAEQSGHFLQRQNALLAVAESCTGGLLSATITDVAGSSAWFERGFITYSNQAKIDLLGVSKHTLQQHGAVSTETAQEMVTGVLQHSLAHLAIAVTGIAGPTGGSLDKPIGTVYIAWQWRNQPAVIQRQQFYGSRDMIRKQTVITALEWILTTNLTRGGIAPSP